jgi:NAD(P)H-flavin reductase
MLLTATIDHVSAATPRAALVRVALDGQFPFAAGQAVLVGLHGQPERRPYSIAVAPAEAARKGRLEFLMGLGPDGTPGTHLPRAAPGVKVDVEGPFGTFAFPDPPDARRFLFVAGGSGIAPLRAMVQQALLGDPIWRLALVYSARAPEEFAFDGELRQLAAAGRLAYYPTTTRHMDDSWVGGRGRISRELLEGALDGPDTLCFVCGPDALVHDVPRMLRDLGIPPGRIRVEEWVQPRPDGSGVVDEEN